MATDVINITDAQAKHIISLDEGHFVDLKSKDIMPAKVTKHLSAFSNAEGGEIYIGIEDNPRKWNGFNKPEEANGLIQTIEEFFPLGSEVNYCFLTNNKYQGLVFKLEIQKSHSIKYSSDKKVYLRRGAQSLFLEGEEIDRLKKNKGITSFETEILNIPKDTIENSEPIIGFLINVVPTAEPGPWLRKQFLLVENQPTVAGLLLFAEEPQAALPKRCGIKIYRYKTKDVAGTREVLDGNPLTIEGHLYDQIFSAIKQTTSIIQSAKIQSPDGLETVKYPAETLHEIVTNAVLHRDYSIADDIHIRIFDNRVEVQSPGHLPGHVTVKNILDERFSRNPAIVRFLNKFPNPPNKDVGEGLNTAFNAMRNMRLKSPEIEQKENFVLVTIRHETLATPQELIVKYLKDNAQIGNSAAREICHIGSENQMKRILQKMVASNIIEKVPGTSGWKTAYQLKN